MARHHHAADLDGDGAVTQDDYDLVTANLGNFGVGDIDRSGIADIKDQAMANDSTPALPRGEISKTDNIVGYAGYLFNAEIHGAGMYTVRHRHYAPDLGRWLTRDPLGYIDGMNTYEYVRGRPIQLTDASGLMTKSKCREHFLYCRQNDAVIMHLTQQLAGCSRPLHRVTCRSNDGEPGRYDKCGGQLGGYYCCGTQEIILCADQLQTQNDVCAVLRHELIHLLDQCKNRNECEATDDRCGTLSSCKHRACMEIRAYAFDGRCCVEGGSGPELDEECVLRGARWSVNWGGCSDRDLEQAVDECMPGDSACSDSCYFDNPWPLPRD